MKVVIRSRKGPLYFLHGVWVADNSEAHDFITTERALATCARWALNDVEIVLQHGSGQDAKFFLPFQPSAHDIVQKQATFGSN